MPITRPEARLLPLLVLVLALACGGCSSDASGSTRTRTGEEASAAQHIERVLRQRARSLRRGDRSAFLRTVDRSRPAAARRARVVFGNYTQLPIARLRYRLDAATVRPAPGGWQAEVTTVLRLAGYDAAPTAHRTLFRFTRTDRGVRVADDAAGRRDAGSSPGWRPWDRHPVVVRAGRGVLGIFDAGSAHRAPQVVASAERGITDVDRVVPVEWSRSVVVYALSDPGVLSGLDVVGGQPEDLDAVTFPVPGVGGRVAGTRFAIHPRMLGRGPEHLDRLVRHELTHVALGERDDDAPIWLSEGIAEWVSVQAIPSHQRLISRDAVAAARARPDRLPDDRDFQGAHQGAPYGLSWWAVETIAARRGAPTVWRLLEALDGTEPRAHDAVLRRVARTGEASLARAAAAGIVASYG